MPVYPTGFSNQAVIPCSHCNSNDQGTEPGICRRGLLGGGDDACLICRKVAYGNTSFLDKLALNATGMYKQTPCSYCDGQGYKKI
jgi:hypothetical protein